MTTSFDALNRGVKRQTSGGTPLYFLYTVDDERTVTYEPDGQSVWLRFTLRDFDGKLIRKVNETTSNTLSADEDFIFRGDQPLAKVGSNDLLARTSHTIEGSLLLGVSGGGLGSIAGFRAGCGLGEGGWVGEPARFKAVGVAICRHLDCVAA